MLAEFITLFQDSCKLYFQFYLTQIFIFYHPFIQFFSDYTVNEFSVRAFPSM